MNVNELIQFVTSFISIFMNINNFENVFTSHISQSLTFLSIHILQKNASLAQLQIETSLKQSQFLYFNYFYLISRDLSSNLIKYRLIVEAFENVEVYKSKLYKKTIINDCFRD